MATWSPPTTRITTELITASVWNNDLVENLNFLKTPTQSRLSAGAGTSTTSTTFVDVALVTLTMPLVNNLASYDVFFTGAISCSNASTCIMTLLIGGTNVGDATLGITGMLTTAANQAGNASFPFRTAPLASGSTIFKVQWKTSAGTLFLNAGWSFAVREC